MKRRVEQWTIDRLYRDRERISFPEYQRQPNLWSYEKKSLLIDSILRDIDIPKLYFNRTENGNIEVVDGQQRLWAIWGFLDGDYPYKSNGQAKLFSDLSPARMKRIENYKLQITVLEDADDEYLRELFLRLQLGLLLITGEKLHAASGVMKKFVFERMVSHKFVKGLGIPKKRYAKETLCAQISINSFSRAKTGAFARTRYEDLLHFFQEYEDPQGQDAKFFDGRVKVIMAVLDEMVNCLGTRSSELRNRSYALSVYLLVEEMALREGALSAKERKTIGDFVFKLWRRLREEINAGFDRKNRELYSLEALLSSAPGERYQIERRHQKLREYYQYFEQTGRVKGDKR